MATPSFGTPHDVHAAPPKQNKNTSVTKKITVAKLDPVVVVSCIFLCCLKMEYGISTSTRLTGYNDD